MEKLENLSQNELKELWQQLQSMTHEETRDCGDVALLWHLAKRLDLVNILDQAADKRTQGQSVGLLAVLMAIHRDTDPGSKLAFLDWYPQTILPELARLTPVEVNHQDLLRSLDYWDDQAIGKAESATLLRLALEFGIGPEAIVWDATSTYFDGKTNNLVRYGYSRDHRSDRPQVNVDLFLDVEHHLPVYSRSYEGNVADVSRFPDAIRDLSQQYPDWRPTVISDCGVISDETLLMMRQLGYSLLLGLPRKGRWLSIMLGVSESQFDSGFYHRGTHIRAKRKGVNLGGCRFHVYVFGNKKKAKQEAAVRDKKLHACQAELNSLKLGVRFLKTRAQIKERVKTILEKHRVSKFLHVAVVKPRSTGEFVLRIQPRKRILKRQAKMDGRSMLITAPTAKPPKELYSTYRSGRHSVESAFGMVKGPVSLRPIFVYNEQRIKGHIFICQLALLLRRVLEMLLKLSGVEMTSRRALKQVKSVRIVKKTLSGISEPLWQLNQIPEEADRIFHAVGLDLPRFLLNQQFPLPP
ncbi:MAG: IS1634 family transposase [Candidatus Thorarchaeota archaeon]|jgi:transposase